MGGRWEGKRRREIVRPQIEMSSTCWSNRQGKVIVQEMISVRCKGMIGIANKLKMIRNYQSTLLISYWNTLLKKLLEEVANK
jgi:hypothetical protein